MQDNGIHGYWNDMNEPAIGGSSLPPNLLFDFDGHKASGLEAKNVYGLQMARSSFESGLKYGNGKRPFVLTRSGFAGVQRYSAVWTGDNTASNEGLLSGVLLNSQMGLSGIAFVGPDLGGYIGDGTKDLFKRWIEVGVFSPFVRNHKEFLATANEPWSYGEEAEALAKTYIGFRYRLMPYIYSKFYEASQTGMPVARSLCINYPFEDKVYDNLYQYQFLFGDAFLVVPLTTDQKSKKIYFPKGNWYDLSSDTCIQGEKEWTGEFPISQLPVYVKESSIITLQSLIQSLKEKPGDTLYVHIYSGEKFNSFTYYEDDGSTFNYSKGDYYKRDIAFTPGERKIVFQKKEGKFVSEFKKMKIILHGFAPWLQTVKINGREKTLLSEKNNIFNSLDNLEDYYDKNYFQSLVNAQARSTVKSLVIDNEENQINIEW
jgi:alpha-glucosidase